MAKSDSEARRAPRSNHDASRVGVAQVDAACRLIASGKLAARELAAWVGGLGVSDSEFRLLWLLQHGAREAGADGAWLDQAALAEQLVISPAQVSGIVERLSVAELIEHQRRPTDRRRQLWRISMAGQLLVSNVIARVDAQAANSTAPGGASFRRGATAKEAA